MYAALWRILPGPWALRALLCALLALAVLAACVAWVFPWVAGLASIDEAAVGGAAVTP